MTGQRGEGMKEVINRLLEEHFEDGKSSLDFSCTNIELSIEKGETKEGSFRIYSRQGSLACLYNGQPHGMSDHAVCGKR